MNPAVRAYLARPHTLVRMLIWRWRASTSEAEYVFVVGAPRSGTTLVQRLIIGHPSFWSINGETGLFTWQNVFDPKRRPGGVPVERLRALRSASSDVVDYFDRVVEEIRPEGEEGVFVEKTPQHVTHLRFILGRFPRSRVIHIHRDGRDCFCSARHHRHIPVSTSAGRFARYWRRCIRSRLGNSSERVFDLSYEGLVREPEQTLREAMSFLGVVYDPRQTDPEHVSNDPRAGLQEFSRLKQPIDASTVGRWREELTDREALEFERTAQAELEALGYEVERL